MNNKNKYNNKVKINQQNLITSAKKQKDIICIYRQESKKEKKNNSKDQSMSHFTLHIIFQIFKYNQKNH